MTTMREKYGDKAIEFAESLIGTCVMGTPDGEEYGIEFDDIWDVVQECSDIVFECQRCGWMCDGSDRYFSDYSYEDICGECFAEETEDE